MKLLILFFLIFCVQSPFVFAEVSMQDKDQIRQDINVIEMALEKGNVGNILTLLSPNASAGLKNDFEESFSDKKIHFKEDDISEWSIISPTSIKIKGNFSASGHNWNMSGWGDYFIFEKINDHWLLLDTDICKKLSSKYWGEFLEEILAVIFPIFLLSFAFWIWMLVDCLNKPSNDKLVWVLILIFLNLLGAILYFFIERKKTYSNVEGPRSGQE